MERSQVYTVAAAERRFHAGMIYFPPRAAPHFETQMTRAMDIYILERRLDFFEAAGRRQVKNVKKCDTRELLA